jgi:hypothetical protein
MDVCYSDVAFDYKFPKAFVKEMQGKVLPVIGRIEISIMEEDQARLLDMGCHCLRCGGCLLGFRIGFAS